MIPSKELRAILATAARNDEGLGRRLEAHARARVEGPTAYAAVVEEILAEVIEAKGKARRDWYYEDWRMRDPAPDFTEAERLTQVARGVIEGIADCSAARVRRTALIAVISMLEKRPLKRDGSRWPEEACLLQSARSLVSGTKAPDDSWIDALEERLDESGTIVDLRTMRFFDEEGYEMGVGFSPPGKLKSLDERVLQHLQGQVAAMRFAEIVRDLWPVDPTKIAAALYTLEHQDYIRRGSAWGSVTWLAPR